jgi:hypothetical protein
MLVRRVVASGGGNEVDVFPWMRTTISPRGVSAAKCVARVVSVFVVTDERGRNPVVLQQVARPTGIFTGNQVGFT